MKRLLATTFAVALGAGALIAGGTTTASAQNQQFI